MKFILIAKEGRAGSRAAPRALANLKIEWGIPKRQINGRLMGLVPIDPDTG